MDKLGGVIAGSTCGVRVAPVLACNPFIQTGSPQGLIRLLLERNVKVFIITVELSD